MSDISLESTYRSSKLFGRELMLRLPITILFIFSIIASLNIERQSIALLVLSHPAKNLFQELYRLFWLKISERPLQYALISENYMY